MCAARVPEEALREAVLNAIAHKDYASGVPIQISVYDDRIMLWNPGQLPPEWTVGRLTEKHASHPLQPVGGQRLLSHWHDRSLGAGHREDQGVLQGGSQAGS